MLMPFCFTRLKISFKSLVTVHEEEKWFFSERMNNERLSPTPTLNLN